MAPRASTFEVDRPRRSSLACATDPLRFDESQKDVVEAHWHATDTRSYRRL